MKALTLTQPYATLIAIGEKRLETRSWRTHYRGPLAIHAAKGLGPVGGASGLAEMWACWPELKEVMTHNGIQHPGQLPLGMIVAVADLVDVAPIEVHGRLDLAQDDSLRTVRGGVFGSDTWMTLRFGEGMRNFELAHYEGRFGHYDEGRYAWALKDARPTTLLPCRGYQGLWTLPEDVERRVVMSSDRIIKATLGTRTLIPEEYERLLGMLGSESSTSQHGQASSTPDDLSARVQSGSGQDLVRAAWIAGLDG